jgi:hypothetical protein
MKTTITRWEREDGLEPEELEMADIVAINVTKDTVTVTWRQQPSDDMLNWQGKKIVHVEFLK